MSGRAERETQVDEQIPPIIAFLQHLREWEGAYPYQLRQFTDDEQIGTVLVQAAFPPTRTYYPGYPELPKPTGREIRVSPDETKLAISWLAGQRIDSTTPQAERTRLANIGITLAHIQTLQPDF